MQKIKNCSKYAYDPKSDQVVTLKTNKARPFRESKSGRKSIHLLDDNGRFRVITRDAIVNNKVSLKVRKNVGRPRKSTNRPQLTTTTATSQQTTEISIPQSVCQNFVDGKLSAAEMQSYLTLKCVAHNVPIRRKGNVALINLVKKNLVTAQ